jgi:hypothetical protein
VSTSGINSWQRITLKFCGSILPSLEGAGIKENDGGGGFNYDIL